MTSATAARRPLILHISSDYPNPIRTPTTDAVMRLADRMTDHEQVVVSLQRVGDPRRLYWRDLGMVDGRRLIAHGYFAPPLGFGMFLCQRRLAKRILRFLDESGLRPDLVHSHRFTFEGIAAWMVAKAIGAPLFYSVRGEVAAKVFRTKPTYRPLFRRMARDAHRIFHISAWFQGDFARHTGVDPAKTRLLPNIVFNAQMPIPSVAPEPRIVIAMTLAAIDKKGLPELLAAFASVRDQIPGVTFEIIGEGPPGTAERVGDLIARNRLEGCAMLRRQMAHEDLLREFPRVLALAMPSHNETFGMVFVEALFSGVPILYGAGTGIDGYLDGLDLGVAVEPGNAAAIAAGLVKLVRENADYRRRIREAAESLVSRFDPDRVVGMYRREVSAVTGTVRS